MTRPGSTLANRYLLEETLGRGASGSVYRAKDTALGIPVVIKVLHEGLAQAHDVLERFKRELILARRVTHSGLCKVFDMQSEGDTHFLVMEFIAGETLTNLLKREGKLDPARALDILRQAASAMGAAHREGIVHRDLKPENIMMRPDGRVAILDFGIATQEGLDRLTRPGFVLGSRKYMAPELWLGRPPTPQSDVWSLGVILFGALCGRLPYRADGPFGVLDAIKNEQRPAPSSLNPQVLPSLEAVINRCLAVEAGDRYPDAAAVERALDDEIAALSEPTKVTKIPENLDLGMQLGTAPPAVEPSVVVARPFDIEFPKTNADQDAGPPVDVIASPPTEDERTGRTHTNVDRPNATWEAWANDAAGAGSAAGQAADAFSASAIGNAFDAVLDAVPEPPSQDTKITPADAWRNADAALGVTHSPMSNEGYAEKTLIALPPMGDSAAQGFFDSADHTVEGEERADLTEDLGRPRVRRDDAPTMFVRTAPEDPLLADPRPSSQKRLAAMVGVAALVGVVLVAVLVSGGDDDSDRESEQLATLGSGSTGEPPIEVPPVVDDKPSGTPPADPRPLTQTDTPGDPPAGGPGTKPTDVGTPVEKPPVEKPPVEKPPVEEPPGEKVPVESPPDEKPPVESPPDENGDAALSTKPGEAAPADDDTWEFNDDEPDTAPPDKIVPEKDKPRQQPSAEDARERARLKKVAESVEKAMSAKGLLRGDVKAIDAELSKARGAIRSKKWSSADASFERALALIDSTTIDAALVNKKLARFNGRYDKVKDDARRAELGKLAIEIGKAMARSDFPTANAKLNQALSLAR